MSNMSYVMFQNTVPDLRDCYDKLCNIESLEELSNAEKRAAKQLLVICRDITELDHLGGDDE